MMGNLSKDIEELVSLRHEYETKRENLNNKIRELFSPEFERIKSNMPEGYKISSFDIDDGKVGMPNPCFKGEVIENRTGNRQLDSLNERFNEEFLRIKEKYGFRVRFYHTSYIG